MSHYTEVQMNLQDEDAIKAALAKAYGCSEHCVEVCQEPQPVYGYRGDNRSELNVSSPDYAPKCDIILRRKHVGPSANDIGFKKQEDGTYKAYISEYDERKWKRVRKTFKTTYGYTVLEKKAQKNGWEIQHKKVTENGDMVVKIKKKKKKRRTLPPTQQQQRKRI